MSRIDQVFPRAAVTVPPAQTKNNEGYPAYIASLRERYVQMLLTNVLGNAFYVSREALVDNAKQLHLEMVAEDPSFVAKAIGYAREVGYMRSQPIFGLAVLAGSAQLSPDEFRVAFDRVIKTPGDLADFAQVVSTLRKKADGSRSTGGRRIKREAAAWLIRRMNAYWAVKYGGKSGDGFSLSDLIRIYHPNILATGDLEKAEVFRYAVTGKGGQTVPIISAFEALKTAKTDDEKIALIKAGRIPHEQASTFAGNSRAVWKAIALEMPPFAILRNLRKLESLGLFDDADVKLAVSKAFFPESVKRAKILPFRFLEADKWVTNTFVKDALREALDHSLGAMPKIVGKTAVFLDVSPSMSDVITGMDAGWVGRPSQASVPSRLEVGSIFGIALATMNDAELWAFSSNEQRSSSVWFRGHNIATHEDWACRKIGVTSQDSILSQARAIKYGSGTDPTLPLLQLIEEKRIVDNIVVITDGEQNRGDPFAQVLQKYRKIAPKAKCFVVDLSPSYMASLVPDGPLNWRVAGWSDAAMSFIAFGAAGYGSLVDYVMKYTSDTAEGAANSTGLN